MCCSLALQPATERRQVFRKLGQIPEEATGPPGRWDSRMTEEPSSWDCFLRTPWHWQQRSYCRVLVPSFSSAAEARYHPGPGPQLAQR